MKFISINIWEGELIDSLLPFLDKEVPDVIVMQEVVFTEDPHHVDSKNFNSLSILRQHLKGYHSAFAPTYTTFRGSTKVQCGNTVFSKFPIISSETIFYDIPYSENFIESLDDHTLVPRNVQHAVVDYHGVDLHVFNNHGIWGFHGRDTDRRIQMGKILHDAVDGLEHVVMAGDFNLDPDTETVGIIERKLQNVFKGKVKSTFNTRQKVHPIFAELTVDMMFVSPSVEVLDCACPDIDISDHLPLISELKINLAKENILSNTTYEETNVI